jgi:two-component system cell cycle sensor histidine kinase/response regulator CckA
MADFVSALPGAIFLVDRDLRLEFAGGAALGAAGWNADAICGRTLEDILPRESYERVAPRYEAALAGERQTFDIDGDRVYAVEIFPRGSTGSITGAYALAHDVTEHRREQRVLAEQMELAFMQAPIGVALVLPGGEIIAANPALASLLGYEAHELAAMSVQQISHPDDLEADLELGRRLVAGEIPAYTMEKRFLARGGDVLTVQLTVGLVRNEDGSPRHFVSHIEDVTERRRVEQQLRETQRLESLGLLAGGIAHDFNNLLVGVMGNASLALSELPADAPARRRIASIELAAQRAGALTRQMLAYSGRGKFMVEPIDLSQEAAELQQLLAGALPEGVEIRLGLAQGLPPIEGDASQVRQIVMNLITNAAEALEGGGVVFVRTGLVHADRATLDGFRFADELLPGDYVFVRVSDEGIGMDAETAARIFDPFFTTKFTGRGLGLAAVVGIVRGHGAGLKVESEPGVGSTFTVLFPARAGAPPEEGEVARRPGTILVVDDEPVVREVASAVLVDAGYQVLTAPNGAEAVRVLAARGDEIALVLLDLTMPGQSAEDTLERLRALQPGIAVVLTSGYNEQILGARLAGAAGFIQKPYAANELTELVGRTLGA